MFRRIFLITSVVCLILLSAKQSAFSSNLSSSIDESASENTHRRTLSTVSWLDVKQFSNIVFFLDQSPNRIRRYDLESETWLADLSLPDQPTAFTIDENGLYVGFGRRVSRFDHHAENDVHLLNTNDTVTALLTSSNFLYVNSGDTLSSLNKVTGNFIDSEEYRYSMYGLSIAESIGKIFARTSGVSPSDIVEVELNTDGTLGNQEDSLYHGDYPSASQTYVFSNGARVADSSGIVYSTSDLSYSSSLAGSVDDLVFYGDLPIALRSGELISYSNTFLETGKFTPSNTAARIFIFGENIYSFYDEIGTQVEITPISFLSPDTPGETIDPNGLAYEPDAIIQGNDDIIYLLSRTHLSIFRMSVSARKYLESIPLVEDPTFMALSIETDTLYLTYASGKITQIKLSEGLTEQPFVNSPQKPCGLATAGEFIFVCDPSGAWESHFTYHPDGSLISQKEWNHYSREYVWSEVNQKMYFFRDNTSPNDLLWENIDQNGVIGTDLDSPYHSSSGIQHPIRVSPDGAIVLLGSGRIYDAITLNQVNTLSNTLTDAVWCNGDLFTIRSFQSDAQVQKWNSNYSAQNSIQFEGTALRLFATSDGLLTITDIDGVPELLLWACDLNEASPQFLQAKFSAPVVEGESPLAVSFNNMSTGNFDNSLWDFGDGNTSSESSPAHIYTEPGIYTVSLSIDGEGEDKVIRTNIITVREPLVAKFSASVVEGDSPLTVSLSNMSTGNFDNSLWDFGDGYTSTISNPTHTYYTPGVYTVSLKVSRDIDGHEDLFTEVDYIKVNQAPTLPPDVPTLTCTPSPQSFPFTLDWREVETASNYQFLFYDVSNPNPPTINTFGSAISTSNYILTTPPADGTYHWKVRAQNAIGWGDWSPACTIQIGTPISLPSTPTLNCTSNTQDKTPELEWNDSLDAINYHIVFYNSATPVPPIVNTFGSVISISPYQINAPLSEGAYRWRVRAQNNLGWSDWSATCNMTIGDEPSFSVFIPIVVR